ncbi:hypothetical protein EIN_032760 [Entamoeba invadens IP1]|uniref:Uncharacterized protein n=1 Tax=Entamoeba invadens IP1 TaxID=370355 RepID=A0A0A1TYB2_ENTIV|nr:hypothetical protein EIN_032760 [Entamoeba invadens IP1]ELP86475.1 hypothetical protein EIN_032760 [Entamoeba invadens IP1]|eukprot:XP_004185821.1 hypothetical protein EIN_032760 [Entamoeba invadens IP1]
MHDPIESQNLHHEILKRLTAPLLPNEFLKLLSLVFFVIKKDTKNSFVNKIIANDIKFITCIPEKYKSSEEKELCIALANHLDWYTTLYATDTPAIDNNISPEQISQFHSDISSENTILSLFSMFCNLTALNWENERLFVNKLFSYIITFLIRELSTTFYRLCCYIVVYLSFLSKGLSSRNAQQRKILTKFADSQQAFAAILDSDAVRVYFPDAPSYTPVSASKLLELLQVSSNLSQGISVLTSGENVESSENAVETKHLENEICKETDVFSKQVVHKMTDFEFFTRIKSESQTPSRTTSRSSSQSKQLCRYSEDGRAVTRYSNSDGNIIYDQLGTNSNTISDEKGRRVSTSSCLSRNISFQEDSVFEIGEDLTH